MPQKMLTVAQAAAELGVSIRRVQAMLRSRRLIGRKLGRDWRITPAAVAAVRDRPRTGGRPKKIII
jgi:excisionase family DNA binding protein